MKLKILLMPVAVIISIVLIIWHIYPAWFGDDANSIKIIKNEIRKIESEINDVKTKKDNVEKLSQSLSSNVEMEQLVNKFYPTYRNDEDVVNSINNIAFAEGVFLLNMGVEYKSMQPVDDPTKVMIIPFEKPAPVVDMSAGVPVIGEEVMTEVNADGVLLEDIAKEKIKFIEATLEIYGNYDQIKKFMTSLNKAGLINNIQSFKVYKKEDNTDVAEEKINTSDILNVDVVIGFGYLAESDEPVATLLSKDFFNKSEFDFSEISNKKDILTGNYKKSEIGETGAVNPFAKEAIAEVVENK